MAQGWRSLISTPVAVVGGAVGAGIIIYGLTISGGTAPDQGTASNLAAGEAGETAAPEQNDVSAPAEDENAGPDTGMVAGADTDAQADSAPVADTTQDVAADTDGPGDTAGQAVDGAEPADDMSAQNAPVATASDEGTGADEDGPDMGSSLAPADDVAGTEMVAGQADGDSSQQMDAPVTAPQVAQGEAVADEDPAPQQAPTETAETDIGSTAGKDAQSGATDEAGSAGAGADMVPAPNTDAPAPAVETATGTGASSETADPMASNGTPVEQGTEMAASDDTAKDASDAPPAPQDSDSVDVQADGTAGASTTADNLQDGAASTDGDAGEQPEQALADTGDDRPTDPMDPSPVDPALVDPPMVAADAPAIAGPADSDAGPTTDLALLEKPDPQPGPVDPVAAAQSPSDAPVVPAETAAQPQAIVLAPIVANDGAQIAPEFDLVRVDKSGAAIVAGRAEPNTEVNVLQNGQVVATVTASARGEFVALFDTDLREQAQSLNLSTQSEDGGPQVFSESAVIVLGRNLPAIDETSSAVEASLPPAVIQASPEAVTVLQPVIGLADLDNVSLDSISYDARGEVVLAGRGRPGNAARAYVDDQVQAETPISDKGSWRVKLDGLQAGRYVLRVDEVDGDGTVVSRVESPFQRVYPSAENLEALQAERQVVIQRGDNLWNIARVRFGDGFQYTVIYDANVDQIRDPDLIYPGQIFDVPNSTTGSDDQ